ncbi:MAG: type IX secretion system sortase PorU [Candidatus Kapaibacteriales bacterium]
MNSNTFFPTRSLFACFVSFITFSTVSLADEPYSFSFDEDSQMKSGLIIEDPEKSVEGYTSEKDLLVSLKIDEVTSFETKDQNSTAIGFYQISIPQLEQITNDYTYVQFDNSLIYLSNKNGIKNYDYFLLDESGNSIDIDRVKYPISSLINLTQPQRMMGGHYALSLIPQKSGLAELLKTYSGSISATGEMGIPKDIILVIDYGVSNISSSDIDMGKPLLSAINKDQYKNIISINNDNYQQYAESNTVLKKEGKPIEVKNSSAYRSLESGSALKLTVDRTGVYSLTEDELRNAGFNLDKSKLDRLVLIGTGGKEIDTNMGPLDIQKLRVNPMMVEEVNGKTRIVFYGQSTSYFYPKSTVYDLWKNGFEDQGSYVLAYANEPIVRPTPLEPPSGEVVNKPLSYKHHEWHEVDNVNVFEFGGGRDFIGENINNEKVFTDDVYNPIAGGEIGYYFAVAHRNSGSNEVDRHGTGIFSVKANGVDYPSSLKVTGTTGTYSALRRQFGAFNMPINSVTGNKSSIMFGYGSPTGRGVGYLDYYVMTYDRSLSALDGSIKLFADISSKGITEYSIDGFDPNKQKYVLDVTQQDKPVWLKNISNTGNRVLIKTDLRNTGRIFFASQELLKPETQKIELTGISGHDYNGVDLILITHKNLMESAEAYKAFRERSMGVKIKIVDVEDIFAEFGGGNKDALAIRDFLGHTYHKSNDPFDFAFFWGHGHYDYRNINFDEPNLVPNYQSSERTDISVSETMNYSTDDIYSLIFGESRVPSFGVARLPIRSNEAGLNYLKKLEHYESNSDTGDWRQTVLLTADDSYTQNGGHDNMMHITPSERISSQYIPTSMMQEKIYLAEFEQEVKGTRRGRIGAERALIDFVNNQGSVMLNWTGHGHPGVWAHEGFFRVETGIPQLVNMNRLPYIVAATCDFSRFDHPTQVSGGEKFVLSERGGAIAMFAATRLVWVGESNALSYSVYNSQLTKNPDGTFPTIGEAIYRAKVGNGTGVSTNDMKYLLFGDPLMKLLIPENQAVVTEVGGVQVSEADTLTFKGLEKISFSGVIKNSMGDLDPEFQGTLKLNVKDGDVNITKTDLDEKVYNFTEFGGLLNKASFAVIDGKFSGEFFIPKDISYSDLNGRIFLTAIPEDADKKSAMGSFNNFFVSGLADVSGISDKNGPEIEIYMDDPSFEECGIVAPTTTLYVNLKDESGVNATGVGVGHKLEAWLGSGEIKINLANNYDTEIGSNSQGSTYAILEDLEPGQYTVTVRAWDIFNNFSVSSACFTVEEGYDRISLVSTNAVPNPLPADGGILQLRHNLPPGYDVKVNIVDASGRVVDSFVAPVSEGYKADIVWNPTSRGLSLPSGAYFYTIEALNIETENTSDDKTSYGKLIYNNNR